MKKHTVDAKQLRRILISLTLLTAAVITVDSLPLSRSDSPESEITDVLAGTQPDEEDTSSPTTDTTADTETASPDTEPPENEPDLPREGISLTILGSCSPGSPLGTSAYGSLNAAVRADGASYILQNLLPRLEKDDLTLVSNACVFTDTAFTSYECAAPASGADIYKEGSVEYAALLAPMFDDAALSETQNSLEERNMKTMGIGSTTYYEKDGIRLAIYCTSLSKASSIANDLSAIRAAAAEARYVLVYYWGVDTFSDVPEQWLKYNLHQFADAGASLIVGTGCDVLRPTEVYGDTMIVYSLGNLVNGMTYSASTPSAILELFLTPASGGPEAEIRLIPCYVPDKRWQPAEIPEGEIRDSVHAFFGGYDELPLVIQ